MNEAPQCVAVFEDVATRSPKALGGQACALVEESFHELAGKLVRHTGKLKEIIDVIRIACANAEAELAAIVAPHMRRPHEAKNLIANLFGRISTSVK